MTKIVDARSLACPEPVILTGKALQEADEVITIVDNEPARDNVSRLGENEGCTVAIEQKDDGIYVTLRRAEARSDRQEHAVATDVALLIASDLMGRGDNQQLGSLLMQSFLHTLHSLTSLPETVIFINNGVKLVADDSPALEDLRRLADQGIEILACGTCLTRLELIDKVAVGQVSNMHTIADTLLRAQKVVSL